jgi:hypothetical protein
VDGPCFLLSKGQKMTTRNCKVFYLTGYQNATFHQFGNRILYGSDNEPREEVVAIVELADGKVVNIAPDKVQFLDAPSE